MAWCKLEDTARHHFKFNQLARELGVRRAEARGLFFGLCAWATVNAPDGILAGFVPSDIEDAADWEGEAGLCIAAMVKVELIDFANGIYEIHDFFDRAESHKLAQRKRKTRTRRNRTIPDLSRDSPVERRGEERNREESVPRAPNEPLTGINHPEVQFFETAYRERFGGPPLTPTERAKVFDIVRRCGEAKARWQDMLKFYADGFAFSGHTVDWLAKNLREVLNKLAAPKPRSTDGPARVDVPSVEETSARLKAEQDRIAAITPEQLAENERKLLAIHAKLGIKP